MTHSKQNLDPTSRNAVRRLARQDFVAKYRGSLAQSFAEDEIKLMARLFDEDMSVHEVVRNTAWQYDDLLEVLQQVKIYFRDLALATFKREHLDY